MSNQEAIALLRNLEDSLDSYCELSEEGKTAFRMAIEALSSSEFPNNSDAISRQQAINAVKSRKTAEQCKEGEVRNWTVDACVDMIKQLPSAQPEIIRCKDCKHWIPYDWMFSEVWQSQNIDDYPEDEIGCDCSEMAMKANDFCSRAERRTE